MKKISFVLLGIFAITGCTSPTHFYIRNFLSESVKILIASTDNTIKNKSLLYSKSLKVPDFYDYKAMKQTLSYTIQGDSVIYKLPPQSTLSLGLGFAGQLYGLKEIAYDTPERHIIVLDNFEKYRNNFNYKSSLIGAYTFWLDIK